METNLLFVSTNNNNPRIHTLSFKCAESLSLSWSVDDDIAVCVTVAELHNSQVQLCNYLMTLSICLHSQITLSQSIIY